MMLYPYHLSDILVRELRITPFTYYAFRKQMFQVCWVSVATSTLTDELSPGQPATVSTGKASAGNSAPKAMQFYSPLSHGFGYILKADIRMLSSPEQQIIDRLLDEGSVCCGLLDKAIVLRLLSRGLVYLEVPIGSDDYVFVPTLDGFVMNRVQGDYFETLLYKIFVAIDGQTSVMELANTIGIDLNLVKCAVSVFCRLGFARKRITGFENVHLHASWATGDYANGTSSSGLASPSSDQLSVISANAQLADLSMALLIVP
ncbi:hypothetical protein niasHT_023414 [Heterodera trifolii]|uniref:FAM91 N-terminal domain-containing protein n=1 Tax=Heterodera trifolii TaxID=157864 RepID=A0ABD2K4S7_9BILA